MQTKIKGWESRRVEIKVDLSDMVALVTDAVKDKFKLKNVDGVDPDGEMYEHAEYATSHSWISKEKRGQATPDQKQALEFLAWLKGLKL